MDICDAMCDRFGQERDKEVLMDFLKLKQYGSVEEYMARFEEQRALVMDLLPDADEDFFVAAFLSGLKRDYLPLMKSFNPMHKILMVTANPDPLSILF